MIASVDSSRVRSLITIVTMVVAAAAIAIHAPGQVSMDTSMQLYEAGIGQSVSWNPPFMSALMRWLGGGELATTLLVLLSSLLTYLSLGQVVGNALRARAAAGAPTLPLWRAGLCLLLVLNPIFFIYVGIVWKDVFFASLLTAAVSLCFAASVAERGRAVVLGALAMVLLAVSMKVRQQGVFMAPTLAILPLIAALSARGWPSLQKKGIAGGLALVFLFTSGVIDGLVAHTITDASDKSSSVGFRSIMHFDMAGTVAFSETPTADLPVRITDEQRAAVRQFYSSERIDYLGASPQVSGWLDAFTDETRKQAWWSLFRHEPRAFLHHRFLTFKTLLDLNGIQKCLPVHIGVDGNADYLKVVGMTPMRDSRDTFVYDFAARFFKWPLYRHWCYLLGLLVAAGVVTAVRMPPRFKPMVLVTAGATGLFYLSYLPTAISCDFRYLYSGVCLVTLLWLSVLAGAIGVRRQRAPADVDAGRSRDAG